MCADQRARTIQLEIQSPEACSFYCSILNCSAELSMKTVFLQVEGIQVQGGTGGIRLALDFLKKNLKSDVAYVSKPTWGKL